MRHRTRMVGQSPGYVPPIEADKKKSHHESLRRGTLWLGVVALASIAVGFMVRNGSEETAKDDADKSEQQPSVEDRKADVAAQLGNAVWTSLSPDQTLTEVEGTPSLFRAVDTSFPLNYTFDGE